MLHDPATTTSRRGKTTAGCWSKASCRPTRSTPRSPTCARSSRRAEAYHADPDGERERWLGHSAANARRGSCGLRKGPGFRPGPARLAGAVPVPRLGCAQPPVRAPGGHRLRGTRVAVDRHPRSTKSICRRSTRARPTTSSRCTPTATTRGCPPSSTPPWWYLETFLYLSDVDEGNARDPPRAPRAAGDRDTNCMGRHAAGRSRSSTRPSVAAPGVRGSLLAYRTDVFHRGVDLTRPERRAFFLGTRASSARAKTGSATRRISRSRRRRVGSRSPRGARRASSSSSASRRPDTRSGTRRCSTRPPCGTRNSTSGRGGDR